jgi:hypothetical protein
MAVEHPGRSLARAECDGGQPLDLGFERWPARNPETGLVQLRPRDAGGYFTCLIGLLGQAQQLPDSREWTAQIATVPDKGQPLGVCCRWHPRSRLEQPTGADITPPAQ